jgi:hypothetical protein
MFIHWLNYGLIRVIDILSSNVLMYRHGGEFCSFVGVRIVEGIVQFIANGMMMPPNVPGNVIARGCIGALNEVFHVILPTGVVQANVGQNVTPHKPSLGLFCTIFYKR